ncbi:ATP-dependent Clp protease ATP-binding subunit ClpA [Flavobacterium sp. 7E]|uniref:AAA family ATPase n=1 Tax=unclassified Flavobacterium TaxID=196869 RepID=UPI001570D807|nr:MULTISPECIES: ATP-dependent Clp protease ATP-binding subunit [unclassified Flavobacterium]MBE0393775.1 Chaperone protein ClpB [Flavobacterium sp. PL002]NRS89900.1 ATP-dependent Clp protease ATP-binding subunit ClpA [Flavobacterium sp. 7E]
MEEEKNIFSIELLSALEIAKKIAKANSNKYYSASHLLKAILNRDLSLLKRLEAMGKDVYFLDEWAEVRIEEEPKTTHVLDADPSDVVDEIIKEAESVRILLNEDEISLYAIIIAISSPGVGFNFDQMKTFPISRNELLDVETIPQNESIGKQEVKKGFLGKYCIHKNIEKKAKRIIAVGRETELNTIKEILCRFSKPNVLLIGDRGIGKSILIDTLVQNVISNQVPDVLNKVQLFELDLSTLIAGASYKGEIEDRLKNCIQELRQYPKAILIIEEIHTLLDKNGGDSGVSNVLKGELAKGLNIIATSTIDEYTKRIEKEQGLSGMFEIVKLEESDDVTLFRMIRESIKTYQEHHKIQIDDETISESIRLSRRYLKEKSLPESAINLIDHTMSVLKTSGETFLKEKQAILDKLMVLKLNDVNLPEEQLIKECNWFLTDLINKTTFLMVVDEQNENYVYETSESLITHIEDLIKAIENKALDKRVHIEAFDLSLIIAKKTGIPAGKLKEEEKQKLNNIEEVLSQRVIGQDHCIATVAGSILESRSGLSKAGQPIASFFFLGPTGTGKTELAKSLAEFLFQDENAIIRFDMSEFKEEHSAALLYGAPPGYVGYEEGGLLVNKIRQKPYSIVLFDEIEKAHASVYDVFLQIMDEGKLHDRLGKEGDFSNAIILFTSNIGADHIVDTFNKGQIPTSSNLMEIMGNYFRPEFLGRLTEIVPFAPISKDNALKIFEIHLKKEFMDLLKNINITVEIPMEAKLYLAENGYNAKYGARPIKSIIRSHLRRPLAKKIISGEVKDGDKMIVIIENEEVKWIKDIISETVEI